MSKFLCHLIRRNFFRVNFKATKTFKNTYTVLESRCNDSSLIKPSFKTRKPTSVMQFGFKTVKKLFNSYWYVIIPIYIANNAVWFVGCRYATKRGFDVVEVLKKLNCRQEIIDFLTDSKMGKLTVTIALFKLLTPLRVATGVLSSTLAVNHIIKNNLLPPKPLRFFKKRKL